MTDALPKVALPERQEARDLLRVLAQPESSETIPLGRWDRLLRAARASELLGILGQRLDDATSLDRVPNVVKQHLSGARVVAAHRTRLGLTVVRALGGVLADQFDCPLVLLKGLAYVAQGLRMSAGRMFDDVDIMVPRRDLDAIEISLLANGWVTEKPDPYDQRYYREWSHELPPMRNPRYAMQLDVHHTIIPVTSRAKPDIGQLFSSAASTSIGPWKVLSPEDQVIHASAHLFLDSDCIGKLRDLADIDGLLREFSSLPGFWSRLIDRADVHGLQRYLWFSATFCHSWLKTPIPPETIRELARFGPMALPRLASLAAMRRTLPPPDLDRPAARQRTLAHALLSTRAAMLRMPLPLLVYHAAHKFFEPRLKGFRSP